METSKQAHFNLSHRKDTGLSANQPLMRVNRSHLSHVKDPSSSADQPLLLGGGVFGLCYKMYYRGMSVAVKQFNKHLSSQFDVIKETSLIKQLDHPCFPFAGLWYLHREQTISVSIAVLQCGRQTIHPSQSLTEP